jgi:hypothetical protein
MSASTDIGREASGHRRGHIRLRGAYLGNYIYRLQAGDFVETKRMIVVK